MLLLGDWGLRMDLDETEREASRMRGRLRRKQRRDQAQDERLDSLESENEQLRICIASLSKLLVDRGALAQSDIEHLAIQLDRDSDLDAAADDSKDQ